MKAIILAAGKGNRLKPYTDETPKPLLPAIKDGGFEDFLLTRILVGLPSYIDEVCIVVKHFEEKIRGFVDEYKEYIQRTNPNIRSVECVTQTGEMGTLGALQTIRHRIGSDERFLVLNGDDLHDTKELEEFLKHTRAFGVQKKIMPGYKSVQVKDGVVTGLEKQTEEEKENGCLIATGTYLLDGRFFDFEPVVLVDGEIGLPQTLLAHVAEYPSNVVYEDGWFSVNTCEDLERLWGGGLTG
jgi:NDP-sugar pyrophosphorylase family protein